MEKQLFAKIDSFTEYAAELQSGLTAIPAVSPDSGGEGELAKTEYLEREIRKLKFDEFLRVDAPDPRAKGGVRPNLIARYRGQSSARTIWIMAHTDIVPPGELSLWSGDPYTMRREGDKITGRGVEDNQQAIVSAVVLARAMMELGLRPACDLALLFNADEETSSKYGVEYVLKTRPELFGKNDVFIVPDAGAPDSSLVEVAEKSILWLKIKTTGKQCHASTPDAGINAFAAGSEMAFRLSSLYRKFNGKDKLFAPKCSTFEPTKKEANVPNVNTIPGDDVFYLDCRVLPEYDLDKVLAEIRRIADSVEKRRGVAISMETVQRSQAAPATPPDCEIAKLVVEGVKKVHGAKPRPTGIGGGTVAAPLRRLGFHVVVYSRLVENAHMPDEYSLLSNLLGDAKVFAHAALHIQP
ncbi:MAG: M20 family metallo-hydrolase [Elusimicrobiales bacterium]